MFRIVADQAQALAQAAAISLVPVRSDAWRAKQQDGIYEAVLVLGLFAGLFFLLGAIYLLLLGIIRGARRFRR